MSRKRQFLLGLYLIFFICDCSYSDNGSCPTWLYPSEEGKCICGTSLGDIIVCNNETQEVIIQRSFCLTSSQRNTGKAVVGSCLYTQNHGKPIGDRDEVYIKVNANLSLQDQEVCDYVNREGQFCGNCKSNHHVSAYSYELKCYQCNAGLPSNIFFYLFVAYFPLTLFLVAVMLFHISVASPRLNVAVLLCQTYSLAETVRVFLRNTSGTRYETVIRLVSTVYGIWNLDFFRAFIPPICLPLNTLEAMALDYLVALYPLLLLVCFYKLVVAHDKGCKLIVKLWRPFLWCSARIRQQWNVRHSIIDAFATFILLSYMKFLNTSFDIMTTTKVVDIHGFIIGYYMYYDGTVEFMDYKHIFYFIIAIAVLLIAALLPLVFILYPMKWFQVFLNKCHLNSPGLRMFMECFQGYYRDRSDGGWDCRWYAAVYPILRIVGSVVYTLIHSKVYFLFFLLILMGVVAIILVTRPYKTKYDFYNQLDALLLMSVVVFCASVMIYNTSIDWFAVHPAVFGAIGVMVCSTTPLIYLFILFCKWIRQSVLKSRVFLLLRNRSGYENINTHCVLSDSSLY